MGLIRMAKHTLRIVLAGISLLGLGACTDTIAGRTNLVNAQYWQRANATSAIFLSGPKAQQMLQRDIARCVTDVRELERLGAVRPAIPGDVKQPNLIVPDLATPEGALELEETPRHHHYLYEEYYNYHDFESCMNNKGWERTQYLPYERADQSRIDYLEAISGQPVRDLHAEYPKAPPPGSFSEGYTSVNH